MARIESEPRPDPRISLVSVCGECYEELTVVFPDLTQLVGFRERALLPRDLSFYLTDEQKRQVRTDVNGHKRTTGHRGAFWEIGIATPGNY